MLTFALTAIQLQKWSFSLIRTLVTTKAQVGIVILSALHRTGLRSGSTKILNQQYDLIIINRDSSLPAVAQNDIPE